MPGGLAEFETQWMIKSSLSPLRYVRRLFSTFVYNDFTGAAAPPRKALVVQWNPLFHFDTTDSDWLAAEVKL